MRTVCITGHRPDSFLVSHYEVDVVRRIVDDIACVLQREYGEELQFNLGGAIGTDQWMGASAIKHGIRYKLYLPFHPSVQARYWNAAQREELDRQMRYAAGIMIADPASGRDEALRDFSAYFQRDRMMVDDSDFVVGFWVGRRRGGTFETMKYALKQSKLVFNGMDRLRLLFRHDLEQGWTPPHLKEAQSDDDQ